MDEEKNAARMNKIQGLVDKNKAEVLIGEQILQ